MKRFQLNVVTLLMIGVAPRLGITAIVILLLWLSFFYATAPTEGA